MSAKKAKLDISVLNASLRATQGHYPSTHPRLKSSFFFDDHYIFRVAVLARFILTLDTAARVSIGTTDCFILSLESIFTKL